MIGLPRFIESAPLPLRKEIGERVQLIERVLDRCPWVLSEKGWKTFRGAADSISPTDLPGFLATHRQYLPASRFILSVGDENFTRYHPPLNSSRGFATLAAFLKLAKWDEWQQILERAEGDLRRAKKEGNEPFERILRRTVRDARERVDHPSILDSSADVLRGSESRGSFQESLQAFQTLAAARQGRLGCDIIFEHPGFIWIEGANLESEATAAGYGKWIVPVENLAESTRLAGGLLPYFETGALVCAKFLTATTELGNGYLLVYCGDQDGERRRILESISGRSAFFVYDNNCHEAHALGVTLQQLSGQLRPADVRAIPTNRERYAAQIAEAAFGQLWGLSDIQRQIIRAVLNMDRNVDPADRANYLALTYFDHWKQTMAALLPKLFDPANAMSLGLTLAMARGPSFHLNFQNMV